MEEEHRRPYSTRRAGTNDEIWGAYHLHVKTGIPVGKSNGSRQSV